MPVINASQAKIHTFADNRWHSYLSPSSGSRELCAWRVEIPAGTKGRPHSVNREEILLVLSGRLTMRHDEVEQVAEAGDAVLVPVGPLVHIDNDGDTTVTAWVTTSVGFIGTFEDGSTLVPEWVK